MTVQLDRLQQVVNGAEGAREELEGPHRRFADAWFSQQPGDIISGDLGALLGQILRHEREVAAVRSPRLRLPLENRGLSVESLADSNLTCTRFGLSEHYVTLADRWAPDWLRGNPRWIDIACASPGPLRTLAGDEISTYARPDTPVPIDPALSTLAPTLTRYRSRTQATAVRTATLGDPSATLHVVLPTGTGKSLVGLAPGLLRAGGNTIVVVPTTALALDQEHATRRQFPNAGLPAELAYYGDRKDGGKPLIIQRLRAGTQRVVFTSPEAIVNGGLAAPLRALAASGRLISVVVDEAHLVKAWGLDFRPEYQLVGALVGELRAIATAAGYREPHVILMTATLSEESLELNDTLFHGTLDSLFVGSAFLRTELRYFHGESVSSRVRLDRLVEAMHHLPRPAIIYTTRKKDAEVIAARLREAGFARTDVFHGDIDGPERLNILGRWSGNEGPTRTDIVVGTSAFGLGVDQPDVRTVIHACVPASVDRYYQEVGRAGRDGHAAVAVWLTAPEDVSQGRAVENATLIGGDKAWNRWKSMRDMLVKTGRDDGTLTVDTSTIPPHLEYPSESNQLWNRNTLTLMERAGLVAVQPALPPEIERSEGESEDDFERRRSEAWSLFNIQVRVKVTSDINLDRPTFDERLRELRESIRATEFASQQRINELLQATECWADLIASEYALYSQGRIKANLSLVPACSGCPAEKHRPRPRYDAAKPVVADAPLPKLSRDVDVTIGNLAAGGNVVIVGYSGTLRLKLQGLVQRTVVRGIRGILASPSFSSLPAIRQTPAQAASEGFVIVDTIDESAVPQVSFAVPTLIVLDHEDVARLSWVNPSNGPLRIVVVPEGLSDPEKAGQRIVDYRAPAWSLDEFMRRL
ncbi:protein DpdF [Gordonia sp. NPDC062954]|uniref:protein DpdF n=1 Tax=Gordonia sp. NPDC062954 TaxID=3364003 RepID=UPI0037C5A6A0